jgi:hypothetical protein
VLLGDNAPTHTVGGTEVDEEHGFKVINLSNVTLIFLPANTTTVVQPLDQGIIASMKAHYRRRLLLSEAGEVRWLLSEAGEAGNEEKRLKDIRPSFNKMSRWVHEAWTQSVAPFVIRNCWHKAGILPDGWVAAPPDTRAKRAAIVAQELAGDAAARQTADTIDIATSKRSRICNSTWRWRSIYKHSKPTMQTLYALTKMKMMTLCLGKHK